MWAHREHSWSKVTPFAVRDLWYATHSARKPLCLSLHRYDATYNPQNYNLNVGTVPCFDGTNVCSAPASYLYWGECRHAVLTVEANGRADSLHPTTAFHQLLAQRILAIL
jgi:hypothetical protein